MNLLMELTGETLLFGLLSKLLYQAPDAAWLQSLFAEDVFSESPLETNQLDVTKGLDWMRSWGRSAWETNPESALAALDADYLNLFVGPGPVLAPPWESVYFSDRRLLFQEQTLAVRGWYLKYGLEIENLYHEPDDHIGLELSFLAHLAQIGLQALMREDTETLNRVLMDQSAFLSEHLLAWVPAWCDLVDQHASTVFYRGLSALVRGAVNEVAGIAAAESAAN